MCMQWSQTNPQGTTFLQPLCFADGIFKKGGPGWQWCIAFLLLGASVCFLVFVSPSEYSTTSLPDTALLEKLQGLKWKPITVILNSPCAMYVWFHINSKARIHLEHVFLQDSDPLLCFYAGEQPWPTHDPILHLIRCWISISCVQNLKTI